MFQKKRRKNIWYDELMISVYACCYTIRLLSDLSVGVRFLLCWYFEWSLTPEELDVNIYVIGMQISINNVTSYLNGTREVGWRECGRNERRPVWNIGWGGWDGEKVEGMERGPYETLHEGDGMEMWWEDWKEASVIHWVREVGCRDGGRNERSV